MTQAPAFGRPRVFIASTTLAAGEGAIAPMVGRLLGEEVQAEVWNENMILPDEKGRPRDRGEVMANLYKAARYYDFVIVVLGRSAAPEPGAAPVPQPVRDNLLFEMGLFMGALGNRRTFVVLEPGLAESELRLPSDLKGHSFGNPVVELSSVSNDELKSQVEAIRDSILKANASAGLSLLPSTGTAIGYFRNFIQPVAEYLLEDTFMVDGREYRASDTGYTIDIVMPLTLDGAGFKQRAKFLEVNQDVLEERKVTFKNGRSYAFSVRRGGDDRHLHLVDFPTPLAASVDVISLVIEDEMKSLVDIDYTQADMTPAQMLEQKELSNFELTLAKLLRLQAESGSTSAGRQFPSRVRLCRQDLSKPLVD
jgi:hypothetical protein